MKRDYSELRQKIRGKYPRIADFANDLGISPSTLSVKLAGKSDWTRIEVEKTRVLLDLSADDLVSLFF